MNRNGKLFRKELSKANGGKEENANRIKAVNGRLAQEEAEMRRIWKEYYEDLYNIDPRKQVAVHICGFDGVRRSNCFGGEPIRRMEAEVRVGKLKKRKVTGNNEVTGERIKCGGDKVLDWIWRLFNVVFENGVVPED